MKKLVFILLLAVLWSCTKKQNQSIGGELITIPVDIGKNVPFELEDISKEIVYVKLSTSDSCLIGKIDKLFYVNDYIIIGSDNNSILFFDKNGVFSHKICRQGDGPEEYIRISDLDIDGKNNTISVLDTRKKQLLQYDWNGTFLRKTDLGYWAIGLQHMNDSVSLLYSGNQISPENQYKLASYDLYSNTISDRFYPISKKKSSYLHVHSANNFSRCEDEILFCELYNDTIYSVSSSECVPRYFIDFGDQKVPSSFYSTEYANIMEFQSDFSKHDFSYGISSLAGLPTSFIISCFIHGKKHFIYYDKELQKGTTFTKVTNRKNMGNLSIDVIEHNLKFYSNDDYLLMVADNELYVQGVETTDFPLKEYLKVVNIEDNPIIGILKIGKK